MSKRQSSSSPKRKEHGGNNNNSNSNSNSNNNNTDNKHEPYYNDEDNKIAAVNQLAALNRNVAVVAAFLREQAQVLARPTSSETAKEKAIDNLSKAAGCLDNIISNGEQAIDSLGPISSTSLSYAQRRVQAHQNEEQIRGEDQRGDWAKPAESKFKRVFSEITQQKNSSRSSSTNNNEPSDEPAAKAARKEDSAEKADESSQTAQELLKEAPVTFTPPANGRHYTVREAIPQLLAVANRNKRLQMWRYLVSKEMVPDLVGRTLRRFFVLSKKGKLDLDRPWKTEGGRKPILTVDEVKEIVAKTPGVGSYDEERVKEVIVQSQKKRHEASGKSDAPIRYPDRTTVRNYRAMFASMAVVAPSPDDDNVDSTSAPSKEVTQQEEGPAEEILKIILAGAPVRFTPPADRKCYTVREAVPQLIGICNNHTRMKQWRYLTCKKLGKPAPRKHLLKLWYSQELTNNLDVWMFHRLVPLQFQMIYRKGHYEDF
jgi:hypothetical protein